MHAHQEVRPQDAVFAHTEDLNLDYVEGNNPHGLLASIRAHAEYILVKACVPPHFGYISVSGSVREFKYGRPFHMLRPVLTGEDVRRADNVASKCVDWIDGVHRCLGTGRNCV